MDISNMFEKNASVSNLKWLEETDDTFKPGSKDWDKKDDLELEFGYNDIDPKYSEMPPEKDELTRKVMASNNEVLRIARALMLRGYMGKLLISSLLKTFDENTLKQARKPLASLLHEEGMIGCMAIDCRNMKDCKEAHKLASLSPHRRHLKYVFMKEACADCRFLGKIANQKTASNESKNAVDSFFVESKETMTYKPFCAKLGLPLMAGEQDLKDEDMDETLIDLVTLGKLTEDEAKLIRSLKVCAYEKVKCAFRLLHKKANTRVEQKVNAAEFSIQMDVTVDVNEPKEFETVSVSPDVADLDFEPEEGTKLLDIDGEAAVGEDMQDVVDGMDVSFDGVEPLGMIDVNEQPLDIEVDPIAAPEDIEVDPNTFVEDEFKGGDEIEVQAKSKKAGEQAIDERSSFDF